jgi:hypothetical protein
MPKLRALLVLPVWFACTAAQPRARGYSHDPARLELKMAPEVAPGEFSKYELKLSNIYDRSLWLNRSLGAGSPSQSLGTGFLEVRGPTGEVAYVCKDYVVLPTKKNYVELGPGESIAFSGNLRCFEGLKPGETYTARAHYLDRNPNPPLSPPSAVHLSTEIVSEPVQFKVVECPPDLADAGWCDPGRSRDH